VLPAYGVCGVGSDVNLKDFNKKLNWDEKGRKRIASFFFFCYMTYSL